MLNNKPSLSPHFVLEILCHGLVNKSARWIKTVGHVNEAILEQPAPN
jgi:hypothetical protein